MGSLHNAPVADKSAGKPSNQRYDRFNVDIVQRGGEDVERNENIKHRTATELFDYRKSIERDDIKEKKYSADLKVA